MKERFRTVLLEGKSLCIISLTEQSNFPNFIQYLPFRSTEQGSTAAEEIQTVPPLSKRTLWEMRKAGMSERGGQGHLWWTLEEHHETSGLESITGVSRKKSSWWFAELPTQDTLLLGFFLSFLPGALVTHPPLLVWKPTSNTPEPNHPEWSK